MSNQKFTISIFILLFISTQLVFAQPTQPTSSKNKRLDPQKARAFIIYSKCFYSLKRKTSTLIATIDENNIDIQGLSQATRDVIGHNQELNSCKYIDTTIGLNETNGCFNSFTNNYDMLQSQLKSNRSVLMHYLSIYNSLGQEKSLEITVDGINMQGELLSKDKRLNDIKVKEDQDDQMQNTVEEKFGQKAPESDQSSIPNNEESLTAQGKIEGILIKLGSDFNSKCKDNQELRVKNPKCYEFLKEKFEGVQYDPDGIQMIEYYRVVSNLRRIFSIDTWNQMYDICSIKIN